MGVIQPLLVFLHILITTKCLRKERREMMVQFLMEMLLREQKYSSKNAHNVILSKQEEYTKQVQIQMVCLEEKLDKLQVTVILMLIRKKELHGIKTLCGLIWKILENIFLELRWCSLVLRKSLSVQICLLT